jgi:hypothetical protein
MDKSTITLVASGIAAASSVSVLLLRLIAERSLESRQIHRARLEPQLEELGEVLYRVVSSAVMVEARDKDRNYHMANRTKNIKALSLLRAKLRYPLWGIDVGFRSLILLPNVLRNKSDEEKSEALELFSKLRFSLDRVIKNCHQQGRKPNLLERGIVHVRAGKISKTWKAMNEKQEIEAIDRLNRRAKSRPAFLYEKVPATVIERKESDFVAQCSKGKEYTLALMHRSGKGSRSMVQPGVRIRIFKRPQESFFRYSIVEPGSLAVANECTSE